MFRHHVLCETLSFWTELVASFTFFLFLIYLSITSLITRGKPVRFLSAQLWFGQLEGRKRVISSRCSVNPLSWTINWVFCLQTGFEAFLDDLYYPFAFFLKFILIFQVTYLLHWVFSKPGSCRKLPSGIVNSKRPGFVLAWFFKPYRKWWSLMNVNRHAICKHGASSWIPKPSEVRPGMCKALHVHLFFQQSWEATSHLHSPHFMKVRSGQRDWVG